MSDRRLENEIEKELADAGFEFEREPTIGGLRPDFLIKGPRGELVIVEIKPWNPRGGNTARAIQQVKLYEKVTGADRAFLVLPDAGKNFESKGVVGPKALEESIRSFFEQEIPRRQRPVHRTKSNGPTVFAAMPFDRQYDDTFLIGMSYAAERVSAACTRVDRSEFSGDIVDEIRRLISESIAVIVDLSEAKANVLYEAGYAHALNKPTVHISSSPLAQLPFDVRNWNTLKYSLGQTAKLREPLLKRLRAVLE